MNDILSVVLGVAWLGFVGYLVWDLIKLFRRTRRDPPPTRPLFK